MNVGAAIRTSREQIGLTQAELGEKATVSRVHINMLESNRKQPTIEVFARIARALGMRPSVLLARAERIADE